MSTPVLLIYDIPEHLPIANPSPRLRRRGVRINLSCWVMLEADLPHAYLNRLASQGATWHVVRFDVSERDRLATLAIESIRADIRRAINRIRQAQQRADACDNADYQRLCRIAAAAVRRFRKLIHDFQEAANRFGIADQLDLRSSLLVVDAMNRTICERGQVLIEAATLVPDLASAIEADAMPGVILADYLEDRGHAEQGQRMRSLFWEVEAA